MRTIAVVAALATTTPVSGFHDTPVMQALRQQCRRAVALRNRRRPASIQLHFGLQEAALTTAVGGAGLTAALWWGGAEERKKRAAWTLFEAQQAVEREARWQKAYIEPKETWTLEELAALDGSQSPSGPILLAADGDVFNVHKGRHFYGPGCEYHVFAGRDATRLLAKQQLEEEDKSSARKPLSLSERAVLAGWMMTLRTKYDTVGRLEGAWGSLADDEEGAKAPDFGNMR